MHAVGHIKVCFQDEKTGRLSSPIIDKKNLVLFEGADIMSALLAGKANFAISHMYFQYRNSAETFEINNPITRGDGRAAFDAIDGEDPVEDWLRVPLITLPKQVQIPEGSADYQSNGVWFTGTSAASPTLEGESPAHNPFTASGETPSRIFSVALVSAPAPGDNKQDRVFSRVNFEEPLELPAGKHLVVFWLLRFN